MKRFMITVLLIVSLCLSLVSPVYAQDIDAPQLYPYADNEYMDNIKTSNDHIVEILDYVSDEDGNLSEYYAGTSYDEHGNLIVYLTNDNIESCNDLKESFPNIQYRYVRFSINELIDYRDAFIALKTNFERLVINTSTNQIDIYFKTEEDLFVASKMLSKIADDIPFKLFLYESDSRMLDNSGLTPASIRHLTEETTEYNGVDSAESGLVSATTSTYIKPGTGYAVTSGGNSAGTIGVCAIRSNGSYVMITHAHDLYTNTPIYIGSTQIGTVTQRYYNSSYIGYDFTYTTVSSSYVSSSLAGGYGALTKSYSESQLISMGLVNGYFIGNANNTLSRHSTSILMTTTGTGVTYPYLTLGTGTNSGDSGGPIYMESSTQTVFLGIVKGNSGGSGTGVPASTIKNTIGLYYYFS